MKTNNEKLLKKHQELIQTDEIKVISHVQREQEEWFINTLMLEGIDVPFKYKRKKIYKNLNGQRINITYYPSKEVVAGFEIEIMNIVRVRVS
ncbi:hypothetical protein AAD001_03725 [Colwelliaceae bacterium 6471]